MTEVLQFALLGLGPGAIYALLGSGLVLIFRASGVLNLAHGAFAMAGAYLFYELHGMHGHATAVSIATVAVITAAFGALVDQLLFRRLRSASSLTQLIATLGLFVVVQSAATIRYGSEATLTAPLLPQHPVDLLGTTVSSDRLWLLAIAVGLTAALTALARWSRVGWAMSAVAENRRAAASLGWSPERISALSWAAGASLAGVAGILIAPITQLSVGGLSMTVIPALAAALIGGFVSFPLTLCGGLLLGIAQSETLRYVDVTGAATSVPLLVIVVVLALQGTTLPGRGTVSVRLPYVGTGRIRPVVVLPLLILTAATIGLGLGEDGLEAVTTGLGTAIVLLSVVVLTGYSGQLSLGQFALAGIGALAAARLVEKTSVPFPVAALAGTVAAAAVGLLFALPALRTRGVELAAVTLGLGAAADAMLFNNSDVTGSASGTPVGGSSLFGLDVTAFDHPVRYALLVLASFAVAAAVVANLRRGRSGRRLLAVRTNERAAASLGISVFGAKLHAFALAGALAGLGGVLLAFRTTTVIYSGFGPLDSITAVAQAVIGGVGWVAGPPIGAALAPGSVGEQLSGTSSSTAAEWLPLISGGVVLVLLLAAPDGVARIVAAWSTRRHSRAISPAPAATARVPHQVPPKSLVVRDLAVRYGGVTAVDGLDLHVEPGKVVGLIGPNGAGKTSVVDALTGFARATGSITLAGDEISRWPAHRRARAGLVRSFQGLELFEDMTVRENVVTAGESRDAAATATDLVRPGRLVLSPAAQAAIDDFELRHVLDRRIDELSYGQRRLVAIARSVATEASILLLDEPAAGLDESESRELAQLVRELADRWGIGVVVIEHDLEFVMTICDHVVVMDFGRRVASGAPADVRADPAAIAAYIGAADDATVDGEGTV